MFPPLAQQQGRHEFESAPQTACWKPEVLGTWYFAGHIHACIPSVVIEAKSKYGISGYGDQ
jgi:hypothetical protein